MFDPDFHNPNAHYPSHEQAQLRDRSIENISYDLTLLLHKKEKYQGNLIINLTIKEGAEDFFLDFHGEVVTSLKINDAFEKDF